MAINFSASFAACLAAGLKVPRQIMYCISQDTAPYVLYKDSQEAAERGASGQWGTDMMYHHSTSQLPPPPPQHPASTSPRDEQQQQNEQAQHGTGNNLPSPATSPYPNQRQTNANQQQQQQSNANQEMDDDIPSINQVHQAKISDPDAVTLSLLLFVVTG